MQNPELNAHLNVLLFLPSPDLRLISLQRLREDPAVRNLDLSSYLLVPSSSPWRCRPTLAESSLQCKGSPDTHY